MYWGDVQLSLLAQITVGTAYVGKRERVGSVQSILVEAGEAQVET